ncbi:MAG: gamma-glutamylcyclotransferase family protein [Pseudomonadota bacterium]|nr:gamma-glutamylcyclotransferase family protein [Pseudomonadota bacterium]MEC8482349.1 gamma-glutamylcyclotransferase family protein [Pseudomonadota bacterium]
MSRHFILGYGSLISSTSRAKTGETGQVWPVKLKGYERTWSVMSQALGMSSVAVIKASDKACNGVLIEVAEDQFPLFDEREHGYERAQVSRSQLHPYHEEELPEGTYWVYHTKEVVTPCQHYPIVLSYVDVILSGCLEHGDHFLHDFLSLTQGWRAPLVNDRRAPVYPRAQTELSTERFSHLLAPVSTLTLNELAITYDA